METPTQKRLVAGLSYRRPWFNPMPLQVEFEMREVALGEICLRGTSVSTYQTQPNTAPSPLIHLSVTLHNLSI